MSFASICGCARPARSARWRSRIDAALTHYESSALAWERAAFIRARACSGDVAAGESFLAAIRPFVWRKQP
jgi:glutamine synthetase adenylyltransferase